MTPMQEVAAWMREFHQTLRAAGFSENQACTILGTYLAVSLTGMSGEETS